MGLLPLMNFLRQLTKEIDWAGPAPKACFVFDDPSLYWRSYGFLNFRALAEHATAHNYCVSVATIPLDTWWVNQGVAVTLRAFSPRLSVLIHGNNHTNFEMLSPANEANHLSVATQAMRRMERLVQRHGIPFQPVMEAPYGALSAAMLRPLLYSGYEAALCTTNLLVRHNPQVNWPATIGLNHSEMLGGGLPVIPRIKMSPDWKNAVLLAAFLQQPIVIAGHHQDAAHGLRVLTELAATINSLDGVTWSDIQGILRTNYRQRETGDTLTVRMYSRHITVAIPQNIRLLCVQRPWLEAGQTEELAVTTHPGATTVRQEAAHSASIGLEGTTTVEIQSRIAKPLAIDDVPAPSTNLWPIARKIMMETRDRLSPLFPFVDKLRRRLNH